MQTTQVFRLEYQGKGIYTSYALNACDCYADEGAHIHPAPWRDTKLGWEELSYEARDGYFFGFESIKALQTWFYKDYWRVRLSNYGAKVMVYTVPLEYCRHGDKQSIFIKDNAIESTELAPEHWVEDIPCTLPNG